jgi:hypothetical protein
MATVYPNEAPQNSPRSEIKVRASLCAVADIVVFHSIVWQSRRGSKQGDGEADFIVVAPDFGILVLEVKGGGIEVVDGHWYSHGGDGVRHGIKNPFDQAKDSKYALLNFFKAVDPHLSRFPIVHGVVFPDIVVKELIGFNAPREIIIDRVDLLQPKVAIERIFRHWSKCRSLSKSDIHNIVCQLAPTVKVRRLLRDDVEDIERALLDLTSEQIRVLQTIRRIKHAAILGGAGTGKTVLAVEKVRQLASTGFRSLLLCYNAPLRQHLASILKSTSVDVETFHSLAVREARHAKTTIPFDPKGDWYENDAPRILQESANVTRTKYDAILIDEAQDFSIKWLSAVKSMLADDGVLYLFADSHQNLYCRGWSLPEGVIELELTVNCRNTRQIAQKVANIYSDSICEKSVNGPKPKFLEVDRRNQIVPYIIELMESLVLEERIRPTQVIILSDSALIVSELRTTGVDRYLFTTLDGHGIPTETLYRFKGLERDVVVLAISDDIEQCELQAAAYVGLSRAKVGLYVIGSRKVRHAIAWDS